MRMRWVAIAVVLLNVIYFGWLQTAGQQQARYQSKVSVRDPSVQQLALINLQSQLLENANSNQRLLAVSPEDDDCWLIGPFDEEISVKQVKGRLAALSIEFPIKEVEVVSSIDYWVYMPPLLDRKEAIKKLRSLQSKSIDSFLIGEGELANGISLGLFTQKERAERVRNELVEKGYQEVLLKSVPRKHVQYWGLFDGSRYGSLVDELWGKINQGQSNLERNKKSCKTVASLKEFD